MNWNRSKTLLVTGASGHLGRRVVEILLDAEAGPVVAATAAPKSAGPTSMTPPRSTRRSMERTGSCSSRPTRSAIACRSTAPRSPLPSALA